MATRSIVPRADNEGGIGTALKRWAAGCFNALSSAAHTITSFTVAGFVKNNASGVLSGGNSIAAGDLPSAIDAAKIGAGAVSSTEFGYLDGVTSAVQTQLGAKAPVASPSFTTKITTPIIDLTGGQIAFPAAQAASAGANTLDDYEEGTWTPVLRFGNAMVGITYDAALTSGFYTKIGRLVVCTGILVLTSKGSSVGDAVIQGLPFVSNSAPGAYSPPVFSLRYVSFGGQVEGLLGLNDSVFNLYQLSEAGVRTGIANTNFANNSQVEFSLSYFV